MVQASGRNAKMLPRSSGMAASNPGDCRALQFATRAGKTIIPEFTVPEGETPDSYLQKLSLKGALKRYHSLTQEARSRLTRELEVIRKWSLAPYFLLVLDIVEEARRRGIPAVARGSAAS